jgi:hypothetical protein
MNFKEACKKSSQKGAMGYFNDLDYAVCTEDGTCLVYECNFYKCTFDELPDKHIHWEPLPDKQKPNNPQGGE